MSRPRKAELINPSGKGITAEGGRHGAEAPAPVPCPFAAILRSFTILLTLFLSVSVSSCSERISPVLVQSSPGSAVVDLSDWSFQEDGAVRLFGNTWEFYWERLYAPEDFRAGRVPENPVLVEGGRPWNGIVEGGRTLGPDGFATYRMRVILPDAGRVYSFFMKNQDSAYSLWVDGVLLASNGTVSERKESYRPERIPVQFSCCAETAEMEIVIQIANYTHKWGGITNNIYLGLPRQISNFVEILYSTIYFLCGAILIMAAYHLFLFVNRKKDASSLWFALFCLSVLLWYLFNGGALFFRLFPKVPLSMGIRLQYFSLSGILPFFLLFFNAAYPDSLDRMVIRAFIIAGFLFMLIPLVTPVKFFTVNVLVLFYISVFLDSILVLIILFKALARKTPGCWFSLAGFLILLATAVYDLAAARTIFIGNPLGPFSPAGLFVFILFQSFILAGRFSSAYEALDDLTRNLAHKVRRRTAELQKARETIFEQEKLAAAGTLVSGISHEIFNPLSGISGPLLILKREIESSDLRENEIVRKHLNFIQGNVEEITAAVNNLKALVKENEIPRKPIRLLPVVRRAAAEYAPDRASSSGLDAAAGSCLYTATGGITIELVVPEDVDVIGDEGVLLQILTNLVSNAMDAIEEGGRISIRYEQNESARAIVVADNGKGMTREVAARAKDPFYTTKAESGGTGLGLYLVEKLAKTMGWRVSISSREDEGTEVRIEVP